MPRVEKEKLTGSYEEYLIESLKDPVEAKEYLNAALEDEDYRVFLLALRDVAKAYGVTKIASETKLNRESLYRMLSEKGNPEIASLVALLRAVGVRLKTEPIEDSPIEVYYEQNLEVCASTIPASQEKYTTAKVQSVKTIPKSLSPFYRPISSCEFQFTA